MSVLAEMFAADDTVAGLHNRQFVVTLEAPEGNLVDVVVQTDVDQKACHLALRERPGHVVRYLTERQAILGKCGRCGAYVKEAERPLVKNSVVTDGDGACVRLRMCPYCDRS